jgi:hypothetical protein
MRTAAGWAVPLGVFLVGTLWSASANAGATLNFGEDQSVSIGLGLRGSFTAQQDAAGTHNNEWSKNFNLDNARIYLSGQVYKWLKAELNTDCTFCGNASLEQYSLLDAILKIEPSPYFNIWGGRLLVPSERAEMDGPFYGNVYQNFKTPFYSSDFSTHFGSGGAGVYGRDQGVNFWGNADKFKYVVGVFNGLRGDSNANDNPLYAARIAYQFLNVEDNPAYYTSSEYFGKAGDILTLGYAVQFQEKGAGSPENNSNLLAMNVDGLFEKPLGGAGVIDAEAEFKYFDDNYDVAAFNDSNNFGMFNGYAATGTLLYLLPDKTGPGTFQPYLRYTSITPLHSANRDEFELGLNYVMAGFNGRASLFYQYGDLATRGLTNFAPNVTGGNVSSVNLGLQIQI